MCGLVAARGSAAALMLLPVGTTIVPLFMLLAVGSLAGVDRRTVFGPIGRRFLARRRTFLGVGP